MSTLSHEIEWTAQMRVWGWAILTNEEPGPLRNPATILEAKAYEPFSHAWDRKPVGERWFGDCLLPVPDWWALHHLPMDWRERTAADERRQRESYYGVPMGF